MYTARDAQVDGPSILSQGPSCLNVCRHDSWQKQLPCSQHRCRGLDTRGFLDNISKRVLRSSTVCLTPNKDAALLPKFPARVQTWPRVRHLEFRFRTSHIAAPPRWASPRCTSSSTASPSAPPTVSASAQMSFAASSSFRREPQRHGHRKRRGRPSERQRAALHWRRRRHGQQVEEHSLRPKHRRR